VSLRVSRYAIRSAKSAFVNPAVKPVGISETLLFLRSLISLVGILIRFASTSSISMASCWSLLMMPVKTRPSSVATTTGS
jgi:hypothetical protein